MQWLHLVIPLALTVLVCPPALAQKRQVRIGLVAGNNLGHEAGRKLRYAEDEVGRFSELLRTAGDFEHVQALRGANRREIENSLLSAKKKLEEAKAAGNSTLFLFYYSGHGDNEALEIGSERLPLRDLRAYLEQLGSADVRVAFVDACQSGALTGVKGGKRAPGYEVRLADPGQVKGMAIVTSSTANEFSQESDDLKGSFFSHNIMTGLRGAADTSRDGQVSLSELYQFTFRRTLASTAASLVGGQHPTYDYRMAGVGDVILTRIQPKDARLAFARESGVMYSIFNRGRSEVIAEVPSSATEDLYIALPAGEYHVVRRALGNVKEQTLALSADLLVKVEPQTMTEVAMPLPRRKGSGGVLRNSAGAYVGVGNSVVPGAPQYLGFLSLSYARDFHAFALRARAYATQRFDASSAAYRTSLFRTGASLDLLFPLLDGYWTSLWLGPSAGIPIMRQTDTRETRWSPGFSYGGALVFNVHLTRQSALTLNVEGGGELFRMDEKREHRRTASMLVGGLVSF